MNHIHNYRLLGQFEGTPKMYECECGDQRDEDFVSEYEEARVKQETLEETQGGGN